MAGTTLTYDLEWENGVSVSLIRKENGTGSTTLFEMEENGEITSLWPCVTSIMEQIFAAGVKRVGDEMAS